jgi:acyl-coenzyme A thioesterase PaaI-like protein
LIHHRILRGADTLSPAELRRRELKHRLAESVRRVVEEAALVDVATTADDASIERLIAEVDELTERFAKVASFRAAGGLNTTEEWEGALTERSPISGRSNPAAAPLLFEEFDGDGVLHAHARYGFAYEGPPGCLHGGVVAGAFDEMVGVGQAASGGMGMTGTLSIKMRRPTPLHTRIDYEAGVSKVDGRKITVWSKSTDPDGNLLCEAEGLMITPRQPLR